MNCYKLKIKEKFLEPIRNGIKRHEYRLATPERRRIKIGDILILTSNQDINNYIKVVVKSFCFFDTWQEPIDKYWVDELRHIYSSKEEAIEDCSKFYTRDDVRKNGIIAFEVEVLVK